MGRLIGKAPVVLGWVAFGLLCATTAQAVDEDTGVQRQYQLAASLSGALQSRTEWRVAGYAYWNGNGALYASAEQAGLTWSATPWLALGGVYRLSRVKDSVGAWNRQRATASATLTTHHNKWGYTYRLFWQGDWRDAAEKSFRDRAFMRNQLQLKYNGFDRVAPYAALEVWNRLDPHRTRSGVDRTRYTLGAETRLTGHQMLSAFVRKQAYGNGDPDLFVLAAEYAYSLH